MPITAPQIREHATFLDTDTLQAILRPQSYPPRYPEFILNHDKLRNLPFIKIFKLVDRDRLTKKFLELKGKTIVCPSCIFAKVKHRAWGGHGDHGFIRKPTQVNLGGGTSIDQIISVRAGRVPRMDGRYIRSRIHCGTVFMDHVSTNSVTHLQYSTSGI